MTALIPEWGRLAPFPSSATDVSIQTEGNSFTRSFRASFSAPAQDIQDWVEKSPGLQGAVSEKRSDGKVRYEIMPGGDASTAEVTIDTIHNKVEIYVSWG